MISPTSILAGACIACLIASEHAEHQGFRATMTVVSEVAMRWHGRLKIAALVFAWLAILSLILRALI